MKKGTLLTVDGLLLHLRPKNVTYYAEVSPFVYDLHFVVYDEYFVVYCSRDGAKKGVTWANH